MRPGTSAVIALDQGSSSSRAIAFSKEGRILARAQRPLRLFQPGAGLFEHDPSELLRSVDLCLDEVLDALPASCKIEAVGIASQRSTFVAWDAKSGRPVSRAPSWMDARAKDSVADLACDRALQGEIHERTGLYLTPFYSAPKIAHLLRSLPEAKRLASLGRLRVAPIPSYILWHWTKGRLFATEPGTAQRTLLFGLQSGKWDERLLELFNIPSECLPALRPSIGAWTAIKRRGRTLPIAAVLGDQQAAAVGLGGIGGESGILNYGTGAFFLLHSGSEPRRLPGFLTTIAYSRADSSREFFLEGTVHSAGSALSWLCGNLGLLKNPREVERAMKNSKTNLLALCAIGGLGSPRWDYQTPTVFWGLNASTRKEDLVRASLESVAFQIADIVDPMAAAGLPIREIRAGGGLSNIKSLMAFQADLLGLPISTMPDSEATAAGAARAAAEGAGLSAPFSPPPGKATRRFLPSMSKAEAGKLKERWRRFASLQADAARSLLL